MLDQADYLPISLSDSAPFMDKLDSRLMIAAACCCVQLAYG